MELSSKGAAFIRVHEGFVPRWYRDPIGVPTIGIGFTWASGAFKEWWEANRPGQPFAAGATMTRDEAENALRFVINKEYGAAVNRFLGRAVPQHVFDAAVSAVFNLGPGALEWRWAQAMKRADYEEAADLLRTTGTTARGKTLPGLVRRRKEEAALMARGDYGEAEDAAAPVVDDGVLMRGERGEEVKALQRDLAALGHYAGAADGIFGPGTEAAVMAFQRGAKLSDDGLAGPKTQAAIREARADKPASPVSVGAAVKADLEITNPAHIRRIQTMLYDKGYVMVGRADGDIGPATRDAITVFQRQNGLPINGRMTAALEGQIKAAPQREVAPARANATKADIADAPTVKRSGTIEKLGGGAILAGGSMLVERLTNGELGADDIDRAVSTVAAGRRLMDAVFSFGLPALVVVGGGLLIYFGRRIIAEQLAKFRAGNHV